MLIESKAAVWYLWWSDYGIHLSDQICWYNLIFPWHRQKMINIFLHAIAVFYMRVSLALPFPNQ